MFLYIFLLMLFAKVGFAHNFTFRVADGYKDFNAGTNCEDVGLYIKNAEASTIKVDIWYSSSNIPGS